MSALAAHVDAKAFVPATAHSKAPSQQQKQSRNNKPRSQHSRPRQQADETKGQENSRKASNGTSTGGNGGKNRRPSRGRGDSDGQGKRRQQRGGRNRSARNRRGGRSGGGDDSTNRSQQEERAPADREQSQNRGARREGKRKGNSNSKGGVTSGNSNASERRDGKGDRKKKTANGKKSGRSRGRNTESFAPDYSAPDMRLVFGAPGRRFGQDYRVHDVVMVPDLFCPRDDTSVYDSLLAELKASNIESLFVEWHGDTHVIADDKKRGGRWKEQSPTFHRIVQCMREYFTMDIKATRLNWYRDDSDWKPYHHDAAAVKPRFAKTQNITVAASFGCEREIGFLHARNHTSLSLPQPNGSCYAFGRDVNVEWKHGVMPVRQEQRSARPGRISIIAWGWVDQTDLDASRVATTAIP